MLTTGPDLTNVGNTSMVLNYSLYMPAWTRAGCAAGGVSCREDS